MNLITFKDSAEAGKHGSGILDCNGREVFAGDTILITIKSPFGFGKTVSRACKVIYSHGAFRVPDAHHEQGQTVGSHDGENVQVEVING